MATLLRTNGGKAGFPSEERAKKMAENHESIAKAMEARAFE